MFSWVMTTWRLRQYHRYLKNPDRWGWGDGRDLAMRLAAQRRDARVFKCLSEGLRNKNCLVRTEAAEALGNLGDARAVSPLTAALREGHRFLLSREALALLALDVDAFLSANKKRSGDKYSPEECHMIAEALGKLRDKRAVEPLIWTLRQRRVNEVGTNRNDAPYEELEVKEWSLKKSVCFELARLGDPSAVEPLVITLSDKCELVRVYAAEALGQLGGSRAIDALIRASVDIYSPLREAAVTALGLRGQNSRWTWGVSRSNLTMI